MDELKLKFFTGGGVQAREVSPLVGISPPAIVILLSWGQNGV